MEPPIIKVWNFSNRSLSLFQTKWEVTKEQRDDCKNKGKDAEVGLCFIPTLKKRIWCQAGKIISFFKMIYRWTARTTYESCIKWTITRCMCVEPMLLTLSVITWWDRQLFTVAVHFTFSSTDCCLSFFAVLWKWPADSWEKSRGWQREVSFWSFSEIRLHYAW